MEQIRILITDQDPQRRSLLRASMEAQPNLIVVGEASNSQDAMQLLSRKAADMLMIDLTGPHAESSVQSVSAPAEADLDDCLTSMLLDLGIPPHLMGFHYLREAVLLTLEDRSRIRRITKVLYPLLAQRCGTTASCVERCIRHAINVAWCRGRVDMLNKMLGCRAATSEDRPASGELIALLVESLCHLQRKH